MYTIQLLKNGQIHLRTLKFNSTYKHKNTTMNIYKITFSHHAPKGSEKGIKCLLLAENDEEVYDWIASEPEISGGQLFNSWKDNESSEDQDWYNEEGNIEDFKTHALRLKGEINDDDYDFSNAYYGIELLGWELLKENITTDYSELIELGIIYKAL